MGGFHAQGYDAAHVGIFPVQEVGQGLEQAGGEEAALEGFEGDVKVLHGEEEADGFISFFGEPDEAFMDEGQEAGGEEVDFGVGHGGEAPVFCPCGVIDILHLIEVFLEFFTSDAAEGEGWVALADFIGDAAEPVHGAFGEVDIEGEEVFGFGEAFVFEELDIVFGVIGHHEHGGGIEPVDEEAAFVVGGGVHGAEQVVHSFLAGPLADGMEEGFGDCGILGAFEEAEEGGVVPLVFEVVLVDDAGDSSDGLTVTGGDPELDFGVFQEGVGGGEDLGEVGGEWGDPMRVAGIDGVCGVDELFDVGGGE